MSLYNPVSSLANVVANIGESMGIKGKTEAAAKVNIEIKPLLQLHSNRMGCISLLFNLGDF
ncbi:MAG: hypothetical protein V7L20_17015 [Nostoc sp.]